MRSDVRAKLRPSSIDAVTSSVRAGHVARAVAHALELSHRGRTSSGVATGVRSAPGTASGE